MYDELTATIEATYSELHQQGYEGKHDKVMEIIQATRLVLTPAGGHLGPWEDLELSYAETAVHNNFLILALNVIDKAISIHQLPTAEYEFGFNYGKKKT